METPTAAGRQSVTKALLRSFALLSLAFAATVPAAPCSPTGSCDPDARDARSADSLLDRLTLRTVDLGEPEDAADAAATTESLAPLLFLGPRVTSILEDVFEAKTAQAEDAAAEAGSDTPDTLLRSPVAETDGATATQAAAQTDHAAVLPKYQRQMYRTDI